jgi:pseudouridine synthase
LTGRLLRVRRSRRGGSIKTLDRALSRAGLCPRSVARELIQSGRVRVGGRVVRASESWVDPARDRIEVDGKALASRERIYLAFHKPRGYLTTFHDPEGRPTIYDLLGGLTTWAAPVGRLDRDTSGLLLLTNDTLLADRITDPSSGVLKTYRVRTRTPLLDQQAEDLRSGVVLRDGPAQAAHVEVLRHYKSYSLIELSIREGRNRQVRRMLQSVGNRVVELRRIAIGPVLLKGLPSGAYRKLAASELRGLGVPQR